MRVFPCPRLCVRVILVATGILSIAVTRRAEPANWSAASETRVPPHLARLGIEPWHRAGVRGAGVKVAIIDSGFRGYREHLGKDLPQRIAVQSFHLGGNLEARDSDHGILCADIIHAIAPDAELLFANWEPDRPETFIEAANWCRREGARIVNCSVIVPAWSDGEGGGAVHAALSKIVGAGCQRGDLLAVACAGNLAQRHWSGPFHDNLSGYHVWAPGRIENVVTPWHDELISIELCCKPGATFALELLDPGSRKQVGVSRSHRGADRATVTVRLMPEPGHTYRLRIRLTDGKPCAFHLVALGSWLDDYTTPGSIPFPGDGAEWLTVGAVEADGKRAEYSSCGPNSHRPKPDLVAPVPFPTASRSTPFTGTSAAAPQVAALAALIWSRHPEWTAEKVQAFLCQSCRDLGPPGHDAETGFGLVHLPDKLP